MNARRVTIYKWTELADVVSTPRAYSRSRLKGVAATVSLRSASKKGQPDTVNLRVTLSGATLETADIGVGDYVAVFYDTVGYELIKLQKVAEAEAHAYKQVVQVCSSSRVETNGSGSAHKERSSGSTSGFVIIGARIADEVMKGFLSIDATATVTKEAQDGEVIVELPTAISNALIDFKKAREKLNLKK